MSDTPNDSSGDGTQGEQPEDGQPPGGQAPRGQATGGQGAQPQGQPPAGQAPQGGAQPQGQPPQANYQTGPSITDIFNRPTTMGEMKTGVAIFAIIGFGLGLGVMLTGSLSTTGQVFAALALLGSFSLAAPIAGLLALRQADALEDQPDNFKYATAAVTGFAGSLVMYIIVFVFALIGLPSSNGSTISGAAPELGDVFVPIIVIALGAAVTAAGVLWALDNLRVGNASPAHGGAPNQPR